MSYRVYRVVPNDGHPTFNIQERWLWLFWRDLEDGSEGGRRYFDMQYESPVPEFKTRKEAENYRSLLMKKRAA